MRTLLIVFFISVFRGPMFALDTITDSQLERIKLMTVYYTNRMSDTNLFPQEECPETYTVDSIVSVLNQRRLSQNIHLTDCIMQSNPVGRKRLEVYTFYSQEIFSEPYFVSYVRKDSDRYKRLANTMKSELQSYLEHLVVSDTEIVDTGEYRGEISRAL